MQKKAIAVKSCTTALIMLFFFFQNYLITVFSLFSYLDEGIALLCLLYFIISKKKSTQLWKLFLTSAILISWGLICNYLFKIQEDKVAVFEDVFSCFKVFFVYLGLKIYMTKSRVNVQRILIYVTPIIKIYVIIVAICAAANLFVNINMNDGERYGFRMFSFVYGAPGYLINQMSYALIILQAETDCLKRKTVSYQVSALFVMLATMKSRAFVLVALYCVLYYFYNIRRKKRLGLEILLIGALVFVISYAQFDSYFLTEGTPRQMFVAGAVTLMKDYFPFGTGFATFGSSGAAHSYSPLYYQLGFSDRWGMTETDIQFLNDNYFPLIFAQFGLIFAIIFCVMIYWFIHYIITDKKREDNSASKLISVFVALDIILSSVQSSFLAHYAVVATVFIFMILFYPDQKGKMKRYDC